MWGLSRLSLVEGNGLTDLAHMVKYKLKPYHRKNPDEELIADLKRVASELKTGSLTQKEYNKHGEFGHNLFCIRFGSWLNALAKVGLKSSRTRFRIKDAELLADLKQVASELKTNSISKDEYKKHGKFNSETLSERFCSWIKAKEKAGLKRRDHPSISDDDYFRNIEEVWIKLGRQPHFSDMRIPFSKYSGSGYIHNFGSWRKALEQFIEYVNKERIPAVTPTPSVIEKTEPPKEESVSIPTKVPTINKVKPHSKPINEHKTKKDISWRLRFIVMRRDNFKCKNCGRSPATNPKIILHVDHIIPWTKDGETVLENLQTLCSVCNIGKSNL